MVSTKGIIRILQAWALTKHNKTLAVLSYSVCFGTFSSPQGLCTGTVSSASINWSLIFPSALVPGADFLSVSPSALLYLPPLPPRIPHCGVWCLAVAWSSQQPHSHTALDCDLVDHIYVLILATYKRQCLAGGGILNEGWGSGQAIYEPPPHANPLAQSPKARAAASPSTQPGMLLAQDRWKVDA